MKILKIFLALSLLPQILLVKVLTQYPEKVELYFSQKIYPIFFNSNHFFLNTFPFHLVIVCIYSSSFFCYTH